MTQETNDNTDDNNVGIIEKEKIILLLRKLIKDKDIIHFWRNMDIYKVFNHFAVYMLDNPATCHAKINEQNSFFVFM